MYNEEHPVEIALAALLAGLAFTIFVYAKMGAFNPDLRDISEVINSTHYELKDTDTNSQ